MYNGVGSHTSLKGSGQSGFVQHSRAIARTQLQEASDAGALHGVDKRTPLEKMRSQKENDDLARRLEAHEKRRAVEVDVLTFGEALRAEHPDLDDESVQAQCDQRRAALLAQLRKTSTRKDEGEKDGRQIATGKKTSSDFAIAFGVGQYKKKSSVL